MRGKRENISFSMADRLLDIDHRLDIMKTLFMTLSGHLECRYLVDCKWLKGPPVNRRSHQQPSSNRGVTRQLKPTKLAIIGCGAMTEQAYLPCIHRCEYFDLALLVDKQLSRAQLLADRYHTAEVTDDFKKIAGKADAAIVVLPHHLHAPVTIDLLKSGLHVLVEKPMAMTVSECDTMVTIAEAQRLVLAVGLIRRFYQTSHIVKQIIDSGLLGDIDTFDFREGHIYNWDVASDFPFRRETGGGVLADTGVHVLDLLLWWLGDYRHIEYADDAMGGVEADCTLALEMVNGSTGVVELSRTRKLRNTLIIRGSRAELEVGTGFNSTVGIRLNQGGVHLLCGDADAPGDKETFHDVVVRQLTDFHNAITTLRQPSISGTEGRRSVRLIHHCRDHRQPLDQSWFLPHQLRVEVPNA